MALGIARLTKDEVWDLEVGQEYVVFGITITAGLLGYELDVSDGVSPWADYPQWFPAAFFTITQTELPPDMHAYYMDLSEREESYGGVVFRAMAQEPTYYDSLTDGEPAAKMAWEEARRRINEFESRKSD